MAEAGEEGGEEREKDAGANLEEAFVGLRLLLLFAVRAGAVSRNVLFRIDGHKSTSVRDISVGMSFDPPEVFRKTLKRGCPRIRRKLGWLSAPEP